MGASRAHRPRRALPSRRPARATDTSDAERDEGYRRDGSFDSSRHRFICGLLVHGAKSQRIQEKGVRTGRNRTVCCSFSIRVITQVRKCPPLLTNRPARVNLPKRQG